MSSSIRVVIVVFDGLRPDQLTPDVTPNLIRFSSAGRMFAGARSVFPTVTRVATASIACGCYPQSHGIVGNSFYLEDVLPKQTLDSARIEHLRHAERRFWGRFVAADTLGDCLARVGKSFVAFHTGSPGSAHLINPRAAQNGQAVLSLHGPEASQTPEHVSAMIRRFGQPAKQEAPRFAEAEYAAKVFVEQVLAEMKPDVSLLWFNEPDVSGHKLEIGSPLYTQVLRHMDTLFGLVLDWVWRQANAESYSIFVLSDHGQATACEIVDLFDDFSRAGFVVAEGAIGDVDFAITTGSYGELRVASKDRSLLLKAAHFLMEHPAIGMVFARDKDGMNGAIPGTFSTNLIRMNHARAPDLLFTMRSSDARNGYGVGGLTAVTGSADFGGGMHGGMSPAEITVLLAHAGAGVPVAGSVVKCPAGVIDVSPTVLDLLQIAKPPSMSGRSLIASDVLEADKEAVILETGVSGYAQRICLKGNGRRRFVVRGERI